VVEATAQAMRPPFPVFGAIPILMLMFTSCGPSGENVTSTRDAHASRRRELVESFTREGETRITDKRVIAAMLATPRHRFVPEELQAQAYEDRPLPIGHDQTISQPSLVAFMTQELKPQRTDRVLEIGTGSGYQAAVLSQLVAEVYSIEIVEPLAELAAKTLKELSFKNVHTRAGNGWPGWPEEAPFDAIIVTCAPDAIPPALVEQLREGGRMIIPVGPENHVQELYLLEKRSGKIEQRSILPVRFVPMTGKKEAR
jgi:protein-L-isoaspartate(D-aspartate) O-methyltransferase